MYGLAPVLLGQKLSAIVDVINGIIGDEPEIKVSVTGLFHKMRRNDDTKGDGRSASSYFRKFAHAERSNTPEPLES